MEWVSVAYETGPFHSISVEIISMKDKEDGLARTANMKITEESAVITIQKHKMDTETASFMRPFYKKWKAKSIFQVLLMYRSARFQDLVYFSQQVHLYNQKAMSGLQASNVEVILERIDPGGRASLVLPKKRQSVWKLPFRLDDLPFFDTTFMCDPLAATGYVPVS
uniref:Uncharacterized protein n=1 Tax=Timema bartmani TaxID=61472 RepID=A0A7R9F0M0_9NEOP|nr:unnamed protein product [Timema bartmani]